MPGSSDTAGGSGSARRSCLDPPRRRQRHRHRPGARMDRSRRCDARPARGIGVLAGRGPGPPSAEGRRRMEGSVGSGLRFAPHLEKAAATRLLHTGHALKVILTFREHLVVTGWAGGPYASRLEGAGEGVILEHALASLAHALGTPRRRIEAHLTATHFHDWQPTLSPAAHTATSASTGSTRIGRWPSRWRTRSSSPARRPPVRDSMPPWKALRARAFGRRRRCSPAGARSPDGLVSAEAWACRGSCRA